MLDPADVQGEATGQGSALSVGQAPSDQWMGLPESERTL